MAYRPLTRKQRLNEWCRPQKTHKRHKSKYRVGWRRTSICEWTSFVEVRNSRTPFTAMPLYSAWPRLPHFRDSGERRVREACRLSVAYFRAIHSVALHSVVSLRGMEWTTELEQPNAQHCRKHWVGIHGIRANNAFRCLKTLTQIVSNCVIPARAQYSME